LSTDAERLKCLAEGTAPPTEMTEDAAVKLALPAKTVADIVTGPATFPLFRITETFPDASVTPLAVVGVPSFGGPM